jgi:hypothetical protein
MFAKRNTKIDEDDELDNILELIEEELNEINIIEPLALAEVISKEQ